MTSSTFTTDKITTWCSWNRPVPSSLPGIREQGKNKKTARPLSALAVQIVFYLIAYYGATMRYICSAVKAYYPGDRYLPLGYPTGWVRITR